MSDYENVIKGKLKLKGKALDVKASGDTGGGVSKKKKHKIKNLSYALSTHPFTGGHAVDHADASETENGDGKGKTAVLDDHLMPAGRRTFVLFSDCLTFLNLYVELPNFIVRRHTIPLLDLSKEFCRRGLKVSLITTPSNSPFIRSYTSQYSDDIKLVEIPFPKVEGLAKGCENMSQLTSHDPE
ncbi:hypothetical protein ACOSQ3_008101 [Xanthoceras sorbifolium]